MEEIVDILKITLPAGIVLYGMFLLARTFLQKELERKLLEIKLKNSDLVVPSRLQAYERICLLLERITPSNLVPRVNDSQYNCAVLHQFLLSEIRNEFNHNLSQQVYMGHHTWNVVKKAIEEVTKVVNISAQNVNPEDRSVSLARVIIQTWGSLEKDPVEIALQQLKTEIQQIF